MRILSVNVGDSRPITIKHRTIQTGIYKIPVTKAVVVTRSGLQGDVLIEPRKMGLEHNAVYAYPHEHYAYWQRELNRESFPLGQFGENLTITGLLEEEVRIGDIFRFGNTVLQVAHPRIPCAKLNERMGLRFSSMFLASRKVGYYFRVLTEGSVAAGDHIELLERDAASPTMEEFVRVTQFEYWDVLALQNLLRARDLMPAWREMIESKLARAQAADGWHGLRELELVRREQECTDTVSLYLKCARGRALPPFHGGQRLLVVLGGHSAQQQRRSYALSGNPQDLATYRITVRHMTAPDKTLPDGIVSSHLCALQVGERIQCAAPHGPHRQPDNGRMTVILSQGLGIAPMLGLLYELAAQPSRGVFVMHEPSAHDPQALLREVSALLKNNPDFIQLPATTKCNADGLIQHGVSLAQTDFHIAGSRAFVETRVNELAAAGVSAAALITQSFD